MSKRPTWDEYFLGLMHEVSKRATCDRGRSGCIVVQGKQIICSGYVGSPPGLPHCDEVDHLMKKITDAAGNTSDHCLRTIHAEQNAIAQAARHGISLEGSTLYCRMEPCRRCAMLIMASGVKRVVCEKRYHSGQETREMFVEGGITLEVIEDAVLGYE